MKFTDDTYKQYADIVYKYLLSKVHNEYLAQELTQETFYQAIRSIDKYDYSCKLSTWLCAIAKNQLLSYQRKHPPFEELDTLTEAASSAENIVLEYENRIEWMKRLHLCPEPFREVLYLRIFGGLSYKEIGEIMSKTENWARVTFYRGKEKIKKEFISDE